MWNPSELGASLALWLDAEDTSTITLNGSNVSQWDDKSGNGRHVSQATAANQPAYLATGFNSKPVVSVHALWCFNSQSTFVVLHCFRTRTCDTCQSKGHLQMSRTARTYE